MTKVSDRIIISAIGVGASKFLGVRRIFSEFLQTCPKNHFLATFCANKRILFHDDRFWNDLPKKKRSSCDCAHVGGHFCPYFQGFCEGFHRFCPDLRRFCPDFHKIKTFVGTLAPPAPPPPTPLISAACSFTFGCTNVLIKDLCLQYKQVLTAPDYIRSATPVVHCKRLRLSRLGYMVKT